MEKFWQIIYMYTNDDIELSDDYNDFDHACADYFYMTSHDADDYQYVVLREIETDREDYEEIKEIDSWTNEDCE